MWSKKSGCQLNKSINLLMREICSEAKQRQWLLSAGLSTPLSNLWQICTTYSYGKFLIYPRYMEILSNQKRSIRYYQYVLGHVHIVTCSPLYDPCQMTAVRGASATRFRSLWCGRALQGADATVAGASRYHAAQHSAWSVKRMHTLDIFWTVRHCPLRNLWERASTVSCRRWFMSDSLLDWSCHVPFFSLLQNS